MARKNKIQFAVGVRDDASHSLQRINKEVGTLGSSLKRLGSIVVGGLGVAEIARQADTYRLLQNRLKLVTSGTEELKGRLLLFRLKPGPRSHQPLTYTLVSLDRPGHLA